MITKKRTFSLICSIITSMYLTLFVCHDIETSVLVRSLVYLYFLVLCFAVQQLPSKEPLKKETRPVFRFICYLLALSLLLVFHGTFIPASYETTISISAIPCDDNCYREVWLTSVSKDGAPVSQNEMEVSANKGWTYSTQNSCYVYYPSENSDNTNELTLSFPCKTVTLGFAKNPWSGSVEVKSDDRVLTTIPLQSDELDDTSDSFNLGVAKEHTPLQIVLYSVGSWMVLCFFLNRSLSYLIFKIKNVHKK